MDPEEQKIFFPFFSFRVDDFEYVQIKQRYEIKLICFGKLRKTILSIGNNMSGPGGHNKKDNTEGKYCNIF